VPPLLGEGGEFLNLILIKKFSSLNKEEYLDEGEGRWFSRPSKLYAGLTTPPLLPLCFIRLPLIGREVAA
jgi:hypothetical protein